MAPHALVGKQAPSFSIPDHTGELYTFKPGSNGEPTALFFYPSSGSYGCTKEACEFKDALSEKDVFKSTKIGVVGVSPDPVEKQKQFVEKHSLTYPVLSDTKGEARKAYGVSKGLLGLTESARVTFVIDSSGTVQDVLEATLNYGSHSKFVTKWLEKQSAGSPNKAVDAKATEPAVATPVVPAEPVESTPAPTVGLEPAAVGPVAAAPATAQTA